MSLWEPVPAGLYGRYSDQ